MNLAITRVVICAFALLLVPMPANAETFRFPAFGLSIESPASWTVQPSGYSAEDLERTDLSDAEIRQLINRFSTAFLFSATKYPEPYPEANASLNIKVRDGTVDDPLELLNGLRSSLKGIFPDLVVTDGPRRVAIGGQEAGMMQIEYTFHMTADRSIPSASRMWIVPRDRFTLIIGSGTKQGEDTEVIAAIDRAIASIRFDDR